MKSLIIGLFMLSPFLSKAYSDSTLLSEGTVVSVKLMQNISSKTANAGDVIEFVTDAPIIVKDIVVVPVGTRVTGVVTDCDRAKGLGKKGKLDFEINYLHLASGKNVKLSSTQSGQGKQKTGTAVAEAVLLTPLFLLKKGKNVKFETGHQFKVFVEVDTVI